MCIYRINEYPFCSERNIRVKVEDAVFCEGNYNQVCRSYTIKTFCEKFFSSGQACVTYRGREEKYRNDIEDRDDTIIVVYLDDCNMSLDVPMGCKVGLGRRKTDQFSRPLPRRNGEPNIGPQRRFKPGDDEKELRELIRTRMRNTTGIPTCLDLPVGS